MPASAPAAFDMIRADTWFTPGDVDDRVHHRHVDGADVRARVPGRDRRDHQLRDADGELAHRVRDERRAAGAAEASDRVEPPLGVEALDDLGRAARHRLDRGAAVACRGERGRVGADGGGDLVPGDVGRRERLSDDPGVDEHDVDAVLPDPIARGTRTPSPSCRACRRGRRSPSALLLSFGGTGVPVGTRVVVVRIGEDLLLFAVRVDRDDRAPAGERDRRCRPATTPARTRRSVEYVTRRQAVAVDADRVDLEVAASRVARRTRPSSRPATRPVRTRPRPGAVSRRRPEPSGCTTQISRISLPGSAARVGDPAPVRRPRGLDLRREVVRQPCARRSRRRASRRRGRRPRRSGTRSREPSGDHVGC